MPNIGGIIGIINTELRIEYCRLRQILKNGSVFGTVAKIKTYYTANGSLQLSLAVEFKDISISGNVDFNKKRLKQIIKRDMADQEKKTNFQILS